MTVKASKHRHSERGNVLWFILVGVVLLGALTLMLTRSGSSVDQSGDFEQQRIKATQLMRYASSIEKAIEKLRTINGCSENEISFESDVTGYTNTKSPSDKSCHIFEPEGAGLEWRELGNNTINTPSSGDSTIGFFIDITVKSVGEDGDPEGIDWVFAADVGSSLCSHINSQMGIDDTNRGADFDLMEEPIDGTFSTQNYIIGDAAEDGGVAFLGQRTGCIGLDNNSGSLLFYRVILER